VVPRPTTDHVVAAWRDQWEERLERLDSGGEVLGDVVHDDIERSSRQVRLDGRAERLRVVDRQMGTRVYAIGHSLGAVAITSAAAELVDSLAAGVCLAGPIFVAPAPASAAMLLVAGVLDPIAPPRRLERYLSAGRRAGALIEYVELDGQGHTLMVNEALPLAVDWLLERRLAPVAQPGP